MKNQTLKSAKLSLILSAILLTATAGHANPICAKIYAPKFRIESYFPYESKNGNPFYSPEVRSFNGRLDDLKREISALQGRIDREREGKGSSKKDKPKSGGDFMMTGFLSFLIDSKPSESKKDDRDSSSPANLNELYRQLDSLKEKKKSLEEQMDGVLNRERSVLVGVFEKVKSDPVMKRQVYDILESNAISLLPETKMVSLMIGNPYSSKETLTAKNADMIRELVRDGYFVIYDADTVVAPQIAELVGAGGVGISAVKSEKSSSGRVVKIENDYIRMMTLSHPHLTITTPDSMTGIGIHLNTGVGFVLDSTGTFKNAPVDWQKDLKASFRDLGLKFSKDTLRIADLSDLKHIKYESGAPLLQVQTAVNYIRYKFEQFNFPSMVGMLTSALSMRQAVEMNQGLGGTVVFGSGKYDMPSVPFIYQVGFQGARLGIPVATGGSGGAMQVANTGAYNGGGISIGIPIVGANSLSTEKKTFSDVQTITIPSTAYDVRIPALLYNRNHVSFAPGGNGTIKEFAVLLTGFPRLSQQVQKISFLQSSYYQPLVNWLHKLGMPQPLLQKIQVVSSEKEIPALMKSVQTETDAARIGPVRKDVDKFEFPPAEDDYWD